MPPTRGNHRTFSLASSCRHRMPVTLSRRARGFQKKTSALRLNVLALAALFVLCPSNARAQVHLPLELQAPRLVEDPTVDHRGFPSRVTVYEFREAEPLTAAEHVRWHGLRFLRLDEEWRSERQRGPPMHAVERSHSADLLGGITRVGEYYTKIQVGGQKVRVQVDTGSSTLAFPMAECTNCLQSDLRYNLRRSSNPAARIVSCGNPLCAPDKCSSHSCAACSSKDACCSDENPSACGFKLKYGDGSFARGSLVVDTLAWGSEEDQEKNSSLSAPVVFGGILADSREFERPIVDGIMGFAYQALACNPTCVEPPFQQLVKAGVVADKFAICMTPHGGKLVLGETDETLANGRVSYVPLALSRIPTFYTVNISSTLTIGEGSLSLPNFRYAVVDSGTTLIAVTEVTFRLIMQYMTTHYCHIPHMCDTVTWFRPAACVLISDDLLAQMPTFVFHLGENGEYDLKLAPEDYMVVSAENGQELRCVGFMALKALAPGTDIILGNTIMLRYLTVYDRANKRMGFAPSSKTCGAPALCSAYTQCVECAEEPACAYDFKKKECLATEDAGYSMFSFPICRGKNCACGLSQQAYFAYGVGSGFAGALVALGSLIAVLMLCGVIGRKKTADEAVALPTGDSGIVSRSVDGDEPLPLVENEKA